MLTEVMGAIKPRARAQEFRTDSARSCQRSLRGESAGALEYWTMALVYWFSYLDEWRMRSSSSEVRCAWSAYHQSRS